MYVANIYIYVVKTRVFYMVDICVTIVFIMKHLHSIDINIYILYIIYIYIYISYIIYL